MNINWVRLRRALLLALGRLVTVAFIATVFLAIGYVFSLVIDYSASAIALTAVIVVAYSTYTYLYYKRQ